MATIELTDEQITFLKAQLLARANALVQVLENKGETVDPDEYDEAEEHQAIARSILDRLPK